MVVPYPHCHPLKTEPSVYLMAALYIVWWAITRMVEEKYRTHVLSLMLVFLAVPFVLGPPMDHNMMALCPDPLPVWVVTWQTQVLHYRQWMMLVYPIGVLHDGALMGHGTPRYLSPVFLIVFYYLFFKYYSGLLFP